MCEGRGAGVDGGSEREGRGAKNRQKSATFRGDQGFGDMKTFLKVLLIVVAVIVALKLLPIALGLGCVVAAILAGLAVLGVSLAALLVCAALVVAAVLSPVWMPVLAIIGVIALFRRGGAAKMV